MTKQPLGPWKVVAQPHDGFSIEDENGKRICVIENVAHALLIAAAPELLEVCKALIDLANESEVQPKSRDWQIFQTLLKASNAGILASTAIAKAAGSKE